ncbi:MAG: phage holin family protein, partial [Armatimonadetes bacterium]|nr:phage holin family protein [Armatimonadota bacterium]
MRNWLMRWVINALALGIVTRLNIGVTAEGVEPLLIAALLIGLANSVVRPIL